MHGFDEPRSARGARFRKHVPPTAKVKASYRRRASWVLGDLYRAAAKFHEYGEILPVAPWLKVLANVLSSAPEGRTGSRRARHAPERWELSYQSLALAARRCDLEATQNEIAGQVAETKAWRARESERNGCPHYVMMAPDTIGVLLGITDEIRREARAYNLGTIGGTSAQRQDARLQRARQREAARRREAGAAPREQYLEGHAISRDKPWEAAGMSRATWYRRGREAAAHSPPNDFETGPCAVNKGRETGPSPANKLKQVRVRRVRAQPISGRETGQCATNMNNIGNAASGFPLAARGKDGEVSRDFSAVDLGSPVGSCCGEVPPHRLDPSGLAVRAWAAAQERHERSEQPPPALLAEQRASKAEIERMLADRDTASRALVLEALADYERRLTDVPRRNEQAQREGSTDRWCVGCGDLAELGWPNGRGGVVWRCLRCYPVAGHAQ
jgi:hypothetical protein